MISKDPCQKLAKMVLELAIGFGLAVGLARGEGDSPLSAAAAPSWKGPVVSGEGLQAILDRGEDVVLEPGKVYALKKPLVFKKTGQKLTTRNAKQLGDYAVLRISDPACGNLVNALGVSEVSLERVILDGNRYRMGEASEEKVGALVILGGGKAVGQSISHCVLTNGRSWSLLHVVEGGKSTRVESNILFGSGWDCRGNGRQGREKNYTWNDGISCAGEGSLVRDNLILDATDGGIVVFGAPGTLVENNVIAAISREALGGINLVDPIKCFAIDGDSNRTSYRGTVVRNNLIDAAGARIHIAVAMGPRIWGPGNKERILVGAEVRGNRLEGEAAGYGFAANGIDEFTVADNVVTALCSGTGDGLSPTARPDASQPFLYASDGVGNSALQREFKPAQKPLIHLLRCNHGPKNALGYRIYDYSDAEAQAAVTIAYSEMLGRAPDRTESEHFTRWLKETRSNVDQVRMALLMSSEFQKSHGSVAPEDMQHFRLNRWLTALDKIKAQAPEGPDSINAEDLYHRAWSLIRK